MRVRKDNIYRSKYRRRRKIRNQGFSQTVNISVPLGGFGERLNAMQLFCARYNVPVRSAFGRWEHGYYHVDWLFSDALIAGLFAEMFRGQLVSARPSCLFSTRDVGS